MNNKDNSPSDKEQFTAAPTNCRALLAITRPLVITEDTPLSARDEKICGSGYEVSPEPDARRAEFSLRKGEILRPDRSDLGTTGDEEAGTRRTDGETESNLEADDTAAEAEPSPPEDNPDLYIRIYLGMS